MRRERALKVLLVSLGLLFCAGIYPLILMAKQDPALAMMMSLYVTLGIFLLIASRNPFAHRSLIAFAAWSSFRTKADTPNWPSAGVARAQRKNSLHECSILEIWYETHPHGATLAGTRQH